MRLIEVTSRNRNDFHWKGQCDNCGHTEHYGDGYADNFYCTKVIPGRYCSKCGLNSYGVSYPNTTERTEDGDA